MKLHDIEDRMIKTLGKAYYNTAGLSHNQLFYELKRIVRLEFERIEQEQQTEMMIKQWELEQAYLMQAQEQQ